MKFNLPAANASIGLALKGWFGVFVVIAVVYALIAILNATTGKKRKKTEQ